MDRVSNDKAEGAKLAPPGAGLPWYELAIARLIFRRHRKRHSRSEHEALFDAERRRILDLLRLLTDEEAAQQVLIKRPRGLEDSSRNWSALMVVEHLRIVNLALVGVVHLLGQGETSLDLIGTADVKPSNDVGPDAIEEFDRSCSLLLREFAEIEDLRTEETYPHPWFGRLTAFGWLALTSMHTKIHRQQVERIYESLA